MRGYSRMRSTSSTGFEDRDTYLFQEADPRTRRDDSFHISGPSFTKEVPTFGAGNDPLKGSRQNGHTWRKNGRYKFEARYAGALSQGINEGEAYTQGVIEAMVPSELRVQRVGSMRDPLSLSSTNGDDSSRKGSRKGGAFGLALQRAMSLREGGEPKKGSGSEKARREAQVERPFLNDGETLWETPLEAAVRRALAIRDTEAKGSSMQRSSSVREFVTMRDRKEEEAREHIANNQLPTTSFRNRANGKPFVSGEAPFEEATVFDQRERPNQEAKILRSTSERREKTGEESCLHTQERSASVENVPSPGEKRWEEAADDEERQERRRVGGQQSQSMRYDRVGGGGGFEEDEEWAVYARNGYIGARAQRGGSSSGVFERVEYQLEGRGEASFMNARSYSMRDGERAMADCPSCGRRSLMSSSSSSVMMPGNNHPTAKLCSICSSCLPHQPAAQSSKKGGMLRACRRLLGLDKKHSSASSSQHRRLHSPIHRS